MVSDAEIGKALMAWSGQRGYSDIEKMRAALISYSSWLVTSEMTHIIALQQAIESHCNGNDVPTEIAKSCPNYAKMLDANKSSEERKGNPIIKHI